MKIENNENCSYITCFNGNCKMEMTKIKYNLTSLINRETDEVKKVC